MEVIAVCVCVSFCALVAHNVAVRWFRHAALQRPSDERLAKVESDCAKLTGIVARQSMSPGAGVVRRA